MKDLLTKALNEALVKLDKQAPTTKTVTKYSPSIRDIKPAEIVDWMKANKIPDNADFDGIDNGYDGWDDIVLSWEVRMIFSISTFLPNPI